jgi:hypothetical protein
MVERDGVEHPTLTRIAFELFSIRPMSVKPERVFSGTYFPSGSDCRVKLRITDRKSFECRIRESHGMFTSLASRWIFRRC